MKRYLVKWGNWDSSSEEVPGNSIKEAINTVCSKHRISDQEINSVIYLGQW